MQIILSAHLYNLILAKIQLNVKLLSILKGIFRNLSNICDVTFCKNSQLQITTFRAVNLIQTVIIT